MLSVAKKKEELKKMGDKLSIVHGDIQKMSSIKNSSINYVTIIYNPVSFVKQPQLFFMEIKRILKTAGIGLIMGQGFPNAIASKINNYVADASELKKLDHSEHVKLNPELMSLNIFSKESIESLAQKAGLKVIKTYGIQVFMQPGPEDFDSENKLKSRVSTKLENDSKFYKQVLDLEMKYNSHESYVNRGMNLMIIVQK